MKERLLIKEYCKCIVPSFSGYGAVFHEITAAVKNCSEPFAIDHTFGWDEGLTPCLGSIEEAQKRFLSKKQPKNSNEYSFHVASKQGFRNEGIIKEVSTDQPYKTFRLFWDLSFGFRSEAKYIWCWISPVMFTTYKKKETRHSMLKVEYPTKKLIFKAIFHRFSPVDTNPVLVIVKDNGKEHKIGTLKEVNLYKENLGFNLKQKESFKCYTATVKNPKVGQVYKVVWKNGYKALAKYLGWFGADKTKGGD
ncbi:MAG: hypothetical protein LHV68_07335 [Elusimicrobia bacterium]|nr:hypothetical protein [Candidatus Liberimonas magnetica]